MRCWVWRPASKWPAPTRSWRARCRCATPKSWSPSQGNGRQATLLRVKKDKSRDILRLEEQLADALTAKVEIRVLKSTKSGQQGELAIAFGSLDELSGLLAKLGASDR